MLMPGHLSLQAAAMVPHGVAFAPSSLFGASDKGGAFDFTDFANLYQSTDTSSPVTAAGQTIKRVTDLSGKASHATEATNGPTARAGYAEFDGINDILATAAIDFSAGDKMTIVASMQTTSGADQPVVNVGGGAGSATLNVAAASYTRGAISGVSVVDTTGPTSGVNAVIGCLLDIAGATATDEIKVRFNGALPAQTLIAGPTTGNFSAAAGLYLGSNTGAFLTGRIYRIVIINRVLSGADLANAETWCGAAAGVTI